MMRVLHQGELPKNLVTIWVMTLTHANTLE